MEQIRDGWIDAVKGIAIFGVVLVHSMGGAELPFVLNEISMIGEKGVQIFFMVAAYLAYRSFEKNKKDGSGIWNWLGSRIKRMAPAYYLALVIQLIFWGGSPHWMGSAGKITIGNIVGHILFLHGFSPYYINSILGVEWYLADYAILILLTPILYKVINNFSRSMAFFVVSSIGSYFSIILMRNWTIIPDTYLWDIYIGSFGFLIQLPVIALGIMLYFIINNVSVEVNCKQKKLLSYALLIGAMYCIVIMLAGVSFKGLTIQTVYGGILFFFVLSQAIYACPLIDNCFWRTLGKNSYTIYLFHYFFIMGYNILFSQYVDSSIKTWATRLLFVWGISFLLILFLTIIRKWGKTHWKKFRG